ncbi:MAG TPA: hypothetical protein VJR29_01560 [bacterium]|nr:hypothetical protein [bacterium]
MKSNEKPRIWGPMLNAGAGYGFINSSENNGWASGPLLEVAPGIWGQLPIPSLKLRSSVLGSVQQLQGEPFDTYAMDSTPTVLTGALRLGVFWSPNTDFSLGLNISGGLSHLSEAKHAGDYAEAGLLTCLLKDKLCVEGAIQSRSFFYKVDPKKVNDTYPLQYNAITKGLGLALKLATYWDI